MRRCLGQGGGTGPGGWWWQRGGRVGGGDDGGGLGERVGGGLGCGRDANVLSMHLRILSSGGTQHHNDKEKQQQNYPCQGNRVKIRAGWAILNHKTYYNADINASIQQFSICLDRLGINSQTGIKNVLKHVNTTVFNLF